MLPARRAIPAAPLLSFPPSPPRPSLPSREGERPRSTLFRIIAFLPLLFIFALLGFAGYAFIWSLCIHYLLLQRHLYLKATLYLLTGSFLLFGCGGNVWMAYWRGGGVVPGAGEWKRRDEEAEVEASGARMGEVGRFVLGEEGGEGEEQEVDEGRESEAREEEEGLLHGEGEGRSRSGRPQTLQVKSDGTRRFCRKCNTFKPDRAHHCSSCRRCVLKMDHHCPWLGGGCVGWANYKFFLLFLLYTGALGIFLGGVMFHELINFVDDVENGFELALITWALAALLGVIFGAAVGLFGLYHLYLASKNRTTIEAMENPTTISPISPLPSQSSPSTHPTSHPSSSSPAAPSLPSSRSAVQLSYKQRHRLSRAAREYNIYDLGWRENLWQVFGSDRAGWERGRKGEGKGRWSKLRRWGRRVECVMPWGWPPGDGQSFPINTSHLASLRRVTEEIYAEAAAGQARSGSGGRGRAYEEDGYDTPSSEEGESDEDGPVRRA